MINYIKICCCYGLLLVACSEEKNNSPDYLFSTNKMATIFSEMQLVEAARNKKVFTNKIATSDSIALQQYDMVFKKYEISKEIFQKNYEYFIKDEELMAAMIDKSLAKLDSLKTQIQNQ